MMEIFEQDEYYIIAMFQKESRQQTMKAIQNILPFLKEDVEMFSLVEGTLERVGQISDQEFQQLDLEPYKEETLEGEIWL